MRPKKELRFETIYRQRSSIEDTLLVFRDKVTGVCYVQSRSGQAGGLTVLVDREGRPMINDEPDHQP